ncbi:hypothetical protein C8J57DRAFT_1303892, partial [Mycena rebaudengoi]
STRHPELAYIHLVEARVCNFMDRPKEEVGRHESSATLRAIWAPRPLISAGGFNREIALAAADTTGDLIAFGRLFISNPTSRICPCDWRRRFH